MQNGNYHPGVVLVHINNKWEVATPATVSANEDTYVFIHGAHNAKKEKLDVVTESIKKCRPSANVLAVDWANWSSFNPDRMTELVQEQFQAWLAESAVNMIADSLFGTTTDSDEVLERHLQELFQKILLNILPVEQTKYIPTVAKRVEAILFCKRNDYWNFVTNGEKASFPALGLRPEKTHLIGHSHGAHIAGMIGVYTQQDGYGTVKKITALDPSTPETHISQENMNGNGWNYRAAKYVEVYRTSLICSSDKLYGHSNVHFLNNDHPVFQLDDIDMQNNPEEALDKIIETIVTDIDLHVKVADFFAYSVENMEGSLDRITPPENASTQDWNVYDD